MTGMDHKKIVPIPENEKGGPSWVAIIAVTVFQIYPIAALMLFIKLRKMWKNRKLDSYRSCLRAIGGNLAMPVKQLAKTLGRPRSEVTATLNEMIAKGYLGPEAYIDHAKGMLYLIRDAADYAGRAAGNVSDFDFSDLSGIFSGISGIASEVAGTLKREFNAEFGRRAEKPRAAAGHNYAPSGTRPEPEPEPEKPTEPETPAEPEKPEADDDAGRSASEATIQRLRYLNDEIDDREVSAKIDRIAELTRDIYAFVEQNPGRENEVRKFMNYYLPTTMKLLTSYGMLEKQSYQGENIVNARRDIEKILDTLVHAFEKQLDQLFATDAVDISSDISVLETMIAKDGLKEDGKGIKLQI